MLLSGLVKLLRVAVLEHLVYLSCFEDHIGLEDTNYCMYFDMFSGLVSGLEWL